MIILFLRAHGIRIVSVCGSLEFQLTLLSIIIYAIRVAPFIRNSIDVIPLKYVLCLAILTYVESGTLSEKLSFKYTFHISIKYLFLEYTK